MGRCSGLAEPSACPDRTRRGNFVTVAPAGSDTIDGINAGWTLSSLYESILLISDGTGWLSVRSNSGVATANAYTLVARDGNAATTVSAVKAGGTAYLPGTQAGRYMGSTASGPPVSGSFVEGDFVVSKDGALYVCTAAGSPGTWTTPNLPVGAIVPFGGGTIPNGYMLCDGGAVSRTVYADLFAVLGTTYGAGDGSTTFNLPDLGSRFPMGNTPGASGGEATHVLTQAEMPSHTHNRGTSYAGMTLHNPGTNWGTSDSVASPPKVGYGNNGTGYTADSGGTGSAGGDGAHNNLPPYTGVAFLIRWLKGAVTTVDWTVSSLAISGADSPKVQLADTATHSAQVGIDTPGGVDASDAAAGDLVIKASGKIRLEPSGKAASTLIVGPYGIEPVYDNKWHTVGAPGEPDYQNSIGLYDNANPANITHAPAQFQRDEAGVVRLRGLLSGSPTGQVVFTLPPGYRPAYRLMFPACGTNAPTNAGGIDVKANGDVVVTGAGSSFLALNQVSFMAEDVDPPAWHDLSGALQAGWSVYTAAGDTAPPRAFVDSAGDMHLSGVVAGPSTASLDVLQLPSGYYNADYVDLHCVKCNAGFTRLDTMTNGMVHASNYSSTGTAAFVSLDGIVLGAVGKVNAWMTFGLLNSWVAYSGTYAPGYFYLNKNGVAYVRGLVKNGVSGSVIGLPATGPIDYYGSVFDLIWVCFAGGAAMARVDINHTASTSGLQHVGYGTGGSNAWLPLTANYSTKAL